MIKKEAEKILKYKEFMIQNSADMEYKNKNDTCINSGDWNHFKITQTIPE